MDTHYWYGVASGIVLAVVLFLFLEWAGRPSHETQLPRSLREYRERKETW